MSLKIAIGTILIIVGIAIFFLGIPLIPIGFLGEPYVSSNQDISFGRIGVGILLSTIGIIVLKIRR